MFDVSLRDLDLHSRSQDQSQNFYDLTLTHSFIHSFFLSFFIFFFFVLFHFIGRGEGYKDLNRPGKNWHAVETFRVLKRIAV